MLDLESTMCFFTSDRSVRLPTRTMKNSCKLLQKMEMKFRRCSRGTDSSAPCSSTRSLKASQESSRFCRYGAGLPAAGMTWSDEVGLPLDMQSLLDVHDDSFFALPSMIARCGFGRRKRY